jgi:glycosyltransferase involved in cell wall biosynthesis
MRIGENPLKLIKKQIEPPAEITVGVLNYIPEHSGYYRGQFDSLKLCLASIRATADHPFDLLVLDNGSCPEVRDYLVAELDAGGISYLILNQHNVGKGNALFQILHAAPGDYVFYNDGDIYYRPGWIKAHLDVLDAFPEAGMVGGIPLRNIADFHTASTRRWAEDHQADLGLEKGDLIPEPWTREFLHSVGDERYFENWIHNEDWRMNRNGIKAYIGASHMQFLIPRRVIEKIPYRRFNLALHTTETQYFDNIIDDGGFLRLSIDWPSVYHIGNRLTEEWLIDEYRRLVLEAPTVTVPAQALQLQNMKSKRHWFWGRGRVRIALKAVYEWTFNKYYQD